MGGRTAPGAPPPSGRGGGREAPPSRPPPKSLRERFVALRNLPPFLRELWATSPPLLSGDILLRGVRAVLPVISLFVGKLIIDEVVALVRAGVTIDSLGAALASGQLDRLGLFLGAEFALAVLSDLLGRVVSLFDSLLSEQYTNATSIRLMQHAATLDLEDFEDSEMQDRLDRARRQTVGRSALMGQLFGQAQDLVTVASFAAGLIVFAPWLIALLAVALVPAFLGEAHFNAQSYSLNFAWASERRVLDYVRLTGASVETAKEVKIFGLQSFLIERYRALADHFYAENRALAKRRALWGSVFASLGTIGYYIAYALIAWRTVRGEFSIGDLTFLSGSFRRLRNLLENLLIGFSQLAGQSLYLDDLYSFFKTEPEIRSVPDALPFPRPVRAGF
ncbi:MAG: ABC transporter ATP-binding protein, partial [Lysobacterales bacterium]